MNRPCVVHAIRSYLAPTEPFVGYQVGTLREFSPLVVCQRRGANRMFDIDPMFVVEEKTSGWHGTLGKMAYDILHILTPHEVRLAERWLRGYAPVLWHFHFAVDAAFFVPLYRKLGIPAVVSCYGYDVSSFPNYWAGLGKQYLGRVFREMDHFLAMSEDMREDLKALGVPDRKIITHYYGIDTTRFRFRDRMYRNRDVYHILCVGSLEPKKGQHQLVRALVELRKIRPDINARLTLVGTGPLKPDLERMIRTYGVGDAVDLRGHVPHLDERLVEYYRSADVFVHFSTTQPDNDKEGIPGTIVEAMASGLPVITTRHAGIPEVVADGVHGVLLDERDSEGIVRSLIELHDHPERRSQLGTAAAHHACGSLDVRTKTQELERIYMSVLDNRRMDSFARNSFRQYERILSS